jgi:DNA-binding winged helix-turn-helix (wHTH) protein/tetratricopeptide (TPR) repeat protein
MSQNTLFITEPYHLGNWLVNPIKNTLKNTSSEIKIQPKHMEVLTYLCSQSNKIVNADELISNCWPNQYVSDNPIHKCIAELRKSLGDNPKKPKYISTIPKRGYSVVAVISKLRNHQQSIQPFWLQESPFRGLEKYKFEHKDIFFGRSHAVSNALRLIDKIEPQQSALLMVLGQSGSGKSSLVEAGIIPKLIAPNRPFKNNYTSIVTVSLSEFDTDNYQVSLIKFLQENKILSEKLTAAQHEENLKKDQFNLATDLVGCDQKQQPILFIDQLEQLFFSEIANDDIEQIFKLIGFILDCNNCLLIMALRNEYYLELTRVQNYIKIRDKAIHYDIPPLYHDDISDIVRMPASASGLVYEFKKNSQESLDSLIINETQSKSIPLPILQHTLQELYKKREGNRLTYLAYENNGCLEGGISALAENTYLELSKLERQKFDELLHNLIQINPASRNIVCCKRVRLKAFKDNDINRIISLFINKRLFQTQWLDNRSYLSLTHDSLITHWQRLNKWVLRNMALLNMKQDLKTSSESWVHNNNNKDFLLRSITSINDAKSLLKNKNISFSSTEEEFIKASEKQYKFHNRVKFGFVFVLVFLSITLTLSTLSLHQKNKQIVNTRNNAENLISFILFDLKDKLEPLGRVDLLDLVGSKTIEYFDGVGTQNLSNTSLINWLQALQIMGESNFAKGDYQAANEIFLKCNVVLERALESDQSNSALLEKSSLTKYWLGYLAYIKKDYELAETNWQSYLSVAQALSKIDPSNDKWFLEISYAFNNLGTLANKRDQLSQADGFFNQSIDIKQQLFSKNPDDPLLIAELADSISWIGKIKEKEGDIQARLEIYQESLDLTKRLIELDSTNPNWKNRLSMAHHRVALSFYDFGQLTQAKSHLQQSLNLLEIQVNEDSENFIIKRELINNYVLLAKINRHQNNFDASLLAIQKAFVLIDLFKTNLNYNQQIISYHIQLLLQQALIMAQYQQIDSAINTISTAEELWKQNLSLDRVNYALLFVSLELAKQNLLAIKEPKQALTTDNYKNSLLAILNRHLNQPKSNLDVVSMHLQLEPDSENLNLESYQALIISSKYNNPDYKNSNLAHINNNKITQQEIIK